MNLKVQNAAQRHFVFVECYVVKLLSCVALLSRTFSMFLDYSNYKINCFKNGHIVVGFLARSTCEVQGCKRRHHTLLHLPPSQQSVEIRTRGVEQGTQVSSSTPLPSGQTNSPSAGGGKVCLRVVPVKVRSRDVNKAVETYALLDSRSEISLCDKTLAIELGVRGQEKTFFPTTQERERQPKSWSWDQPNRRPTWWYWQGWS